MKFFTAFTAALFSLKLVALFAAVILIEPDGKDQETALGSDYELTCFIAYAKNPKQISNFRWHDPNNVTIDANYTIKNSRIYTEFVDNSNTELQLYINKLMKEDTGRYTCVANYVNQILVESVSIQYYQLITFVNVSADQSALIGTRYKIRCQVEAMRPPIVIWGRNGERLAFDPRYTFEDDGLVIDPINESDDGMYRCLAAVSETFQTSYRNIRLEVLVPPKIVNTSDYQTVIEDEKAQVKCEATGKPKPTITLMKTSTPQEVSNGTNGVPPFEKVIRNETSDYTYTCKAENKAGEDIRHIHLNIRSKPDIFEVRNGTAAVGGLGQIQCHVYANPKPTVVIRKFESPRSKRSNDDQYRITVETTDDPTKPLTVIAFMNFSKVELIDDGFYECIAANEVGQSIRKAHFTVGYAPIIDPKINVNTTFTWDRRPQNLTCVAEAIPNATITWYFNNRTIEKNDTVYKIFSRESSSTLLVTPLQRNAFGVYKCRASNEFGKAVRNINLKEAFPPSPVNNFEVNLRTEYIIMFKIEDPVNTGGVPIKSYVVQYKMEEEEEWFEAKNETWKRGNLYALHNLEPGENYTFRFAAINEVGLGPWGRVENVQIPGRLSCPSEPVIMNTKEEGAKFIELDTATSFELRWKIPSGNGDNIKYYELRCCIAAEDAEISFLFPIMTTCVDKTLSANEESTSYEIKDLHPDTYYLVSLRAHNKIGGGPRSERFFKTGELGISTVSTAILKSESSNDSHEHTSTTYIIGAGFITLLAFLGVLFYYFFETTGNLANSSPPIELKFGSLKEHATQTSQPNF